MKVITVIGFTNSGKTTTLLETIKELIRRGYTVNTVKSIHIENFSIDQEGKDSWLHREAGASITAVRSNIETAIIYQKPLTAYELVPFFEGDFLLLEGFHEEKEIPKILCSKDIDNLKQRFDESVFAISGIISSSIAEFQGVKAINALENISELVDLIEEKAIESSELRARS